ncbi:dihydrolipoyl dehydrogenase [Desulfobulbus alkaliphilus]|uniref:dihydrolipoyl dehydrogenase n=1 Tax=Desulfobulbus alkaliphilus TaxID=869814 RepID=UPI0019651A3F|nr:dihydrolipoyl dehydrogenase [Desulfobulbus alkaliphilus]MBM9536212.1 dihydrolipoyl dehydrogenase [Desulfobulbus alkaliphilus]
MEHLTTSVAVLGGGPGGYTAAFRAADLGLSVCLIEQYDRLGGVCLNVGCIPSKNLLHGAALIEEARKGRERGIVFAPPEIDLDAFRNHKESVVRKLTDGLDALCKARNITRLIGRGTFVDRTTLLVTGQDSETKVRFTDVIIATGSHPMALPNCPDDPRIWDSTTALALTSIPKRLLIIGGGIIGMEMAQVYGALGAAVTIVELQEQIIPPADRDLVEPLLGTLSKNYALFTRTRVTAITAETEGIRVALEGEKAPADGLFDAVLVAVGRRANTRGFGLETVGLQPDQQGFLTVNAQQQTDIPHFYAIGDVVGEPMLAHKASHQGKVAAEVIAGKKTAFAPMTIPSVAYTHPEIAWMGLTERDAKAQHIAFVKGVFPWSANGRALCSGAEKGLSKILFDKQSGRIIGAGICGHNAGELIHEAVLALEMGANAEDISKTVHAHPTLAETFAFAAEMVDGSITDLLPPKKGG